MSPPSSSSRTDAEIVEQIALKLTPDEELTRQLYDAVETANRVIGTLAERGVYVSLQVDQIRTLRSDRGATEWPVLTFGGTYRDADVELVYTFDPLGPEFLR
jgi:hypothetical protein